ncbi:MAG: class I SAM-dependent methyltransferase [Bacteroidales bacterium]|nr:class I SAM-dependent methyltransferase [Bacteroidales bacterium]
MINDRINNPKSPKYHVKKYLESRKEFLQDKVVIDIPAGNGVTTEILQELGAKVEPFDLFPEYFLLKDIECKQADVCDKIPADDSHADMVICQEGIEHFSDQLKVFKEFNRVLKLNNELLITTPTYSNLASKLSYLLFESETNKQMPPNEIDEIWMSDKSLSNEIYHGHIFLIGLQKMRVLAKLAGFRIKEIKWLRISKGSLFLFPFLYPFILLSSYLRYFRMRRKNKGISKEHLRKVYMEQVKINISLKTLINKHIFIIFEKEKELQDLDFRFDNKIKPFGVVLK